MIAAGIIPLLEEMTADPASHGFVAALYLNLSCLEEAKPVIGSSKAVSFLINLLERTDPQSKLDSLHALFNLSFYTSNVPNLLQSGIINALQNLLSEPRDRTWTEKSIAVLMNLASHHTGKDAIIGATSLIGALAGILDTGEAIEQEQAVSCLLILCNGSENCCQMVLQEGVIPSLVSIQVNGTTRGREKAQKLLMLFREQRQRDSSPPRVQRSPSLSEFTAQTAEVKPLSKSNSVNMMPPVDQKPALGKTTSRRKIGKTFSFFRKSKNFSGPQ